MIVLQIALGVVGGADVAVFSHLLAVGFLFFSSLFNGHVHNVLVVVLLTNWGRDKRLVDRCHRCLVIEFNSLRNRVVKRGGVFQRRNAAAVVRRIAAATHIDGQRYLLQVMQGVEDLADDDDGLHAQVGQESHGNETEQSRQAWSTDESLNLLTNG